MAEICEKVIPSYLCNMYIIYMIKYIYIYIITAWDVAGNYSTSTTKNVTRLYPTPRNAPHENKLSTDHLLTFWDMVCILIKNR